MNITLNSTERFHNRKVKEFLNLLHSANTVRDFGANLKTINSAALKWTGSRHAMIAILNEEQGVLELCCGEGPEWDDELHVREIDVTTRHGIVSYVAATGKPFRTNDVQNEPQYIKMYDSTRSEAAVPVRDRHDRVRAVINVESDETNQYNEEDEEKLSVLAELLSIIFNRRDTTNREDALIEIGHALDQALTAEEVVNGVIRIASEVLRFQAFGVFLYDEEQGTLILKGAVGRLKEGINRIRLNVGDGITGWVAETGKPWIAHDPVNDPRWLDKDNEIPGEQMASFIAVPVVHRGKTLAVLRGIRKKSENQFLDNRFTGSDLRVLTAIAEQMAASLDNLRGFNKILRSERMAAWGELSAKSSHMIGNRVFALKGDVNELGFLIKKEPIDADELSDIHKSLAINVQRVEEILQDFRDFLTATQISPEEGDFNELVETTVKEIFPRRSPVQLDLQLDNTLSPVLIDSLRLRRAVSELVENAMNYMTEGKLLVKTSVASAEDAKRGKLDPKKTYAKVEIQDTGPGVASEKKEVIFQPFFSGRVKGMGLGLSIVKGIAESHGGTVYEDGQEGGGAKFVILLPASNRS